MTFHPEDRKRLLAMQREEMLQELRRMYFERGHHDGRFGPGHGPPGTGPGPRDASPRDAGPPFMVPPRGVDRPSEPPKAPPQPTTEAEKPAPSN